MKNNYSTTAVGVSGNINSDNNNNVKLEPTLTSVLFGSNGFRGNGSSTDDKGGGGRLLSLLSPAATARAAAAEGDVILVGGQEAADGEEVICPLQLQTQSKVITVIFCIIFCLSVCGNSLVIVTIIQQKWMRTVTNFYLLNLAISDLLLIVLCMPPSLLGLLFRCFFFGRIMCNITSYLQPVAVTASAYTLAVIALERYFAICKPLQSRQWQTKSHAAKMIAIAWLFSLSANLFSLFSMELFEYKKHHFNCRASSWVTPGIRLAHISFLSIVLFLLPLSVMISLYGLIIRHLYLGIQLEVRDMPNPKLPSYTDKSIFTRLTKALKVPTRTGQALLRIADDNQDSRTHLKVPNMALRSTHSEKSLLAKKRVIKMLMIVVVIFTVSWLPIYVYQLYLSTSVFFGIQSINYRLYPYVWVLSYLSTCTNPIIYSFLNRKFRIAFLLAFGCHKFVNEKFGNTYYNPSQFIPSNHTANNNNNNNNNKNINNTASIVKYPNSHTSEAASCSSSSNYYPAFHNHRRPTTATISSNNRFLTAEHHRRRVSAAAFSDTGGFVGYSSASSTAPTAAAGTERNPNILTVTSCAAAAPAAPAGRFVRKTNKNKQFFVNGGPITNRAAIYRPKIVVHRSSRKTRKSTFLSNYNNNNNKKKSMSVDDILCLKHAESKEEEAADCGSSGNESSSSSVSGSAATRFNSDDLVDVVHDDVVLVNNNFAAAASAGDILPSPHSSFSALRNNNTITPPTNNNNAAKTIVTIQTSSSSKKKKKKQQQYRQHHSLSDTFLTQQQQRVHQSQGDSMRDSSSTPPQPLLSSSSSHPTTFVNLHPACRTTRKSDPDNNESEM